MSVLLTTQKIKGNRAWVDGQVYMIEKENGQTVEIDDLPANEKAKLRGVLIKDESEIPPPPPEERGKTCLLMIDLKTKKLAWEQADRPLTEAEAMEEMAGKLDTMISQQAKIIELLAQSKTDQNK